MTEEQREFEQKIAMINSRKEAFLKSPFWFTFWDLVRSALNICFWLSFWLIVAQCNCKCIIN